jgi:hypothetical protein
MPYLCPFHYEHPIALPAALLIGAILAVPLIFAGLAFTPLSDATVVVGVAALYIAGVLAGVWLSRVPVAVTVQPEGLRFQVLRSVHLIPGLSTFLPWQDVLSAQVISVANPPEDAALVIKGRRRSLQVNGFRSDVEELAATIETHLRQAGSAARVGSRPVSPFQFVAGTWFGLGIAIVLGAGLFCFAGAAALHVLGLAFTDRAFPWRPVLGYCAIAVWWILLVDRARSRAKESAG